MPRFKHIAVNFSLVCFGLLVAGISLEVGIRILGLYKSPSDHFLEPHPELGWSHTPNAVGHWTIGETQIPVRINSKGLRDKEYPYQKQENTFRILVLGDSFTEAFQVPLEKTFCKVLEGKLNQNIGSFEVINAGLGGIGTDYELLFLKKEGFKYSPDLLLVAFFPNDIIENFRSRTILEDSSAGEELYYAREGLIVSIKQFFANYSHAYNYLGPLVIDYFPQFANILVEIGLIGAVPAKEGHQGIHLHQLVMEREYSPEMKLAWDVTERLFENLSQEARKRGCRLAVVSIPLREQVYEGHWKAELARSEMRQRQWDLNKPDKLLSKSLHAMNVPLLQLLPEFRKEASNIALYFGLDGKIADGHWTEAGHSLAAELIHQWLTEERLIPINS